MDYIIRAYGSFETDGPLNLHPCFPKKTKRVSFYIILPFFFFTYIITFFIIVVVPETRE